MRRVVVISLSFDVPDEGAEIGHPDGLGKVAGLPAPNAIVAGAAFQLLNQARQGDRRREPNDHVYVVRRVAYRDELASHRRRGTVQ